jgi:hypothetical protein
MNKTINEVFDFSKHGLVVSGHNMMYMAGGEYPDGSASQAFMRYDPVLDLWQEMASLRTPRSELGKTLLVNTRCYIVKRLN